MTKKRVQSCKSVSITVSYDVMAEIDKVLDSVDETTGKHPYGSKSDFFETAAKLLIGMKACPHCGKLNLGSSRYCSECRHNLEFTPLELKEARYLYEHDHPEHVSDETRIVLYHLSPSEVRQILSGETIPPVKHVRILDRAEFYQKIEENRKKRREMEDREDHELL